MALVIVTQNQYILAKAIHHIVLHENYEYHEVRRGTKLWGVKEFVYNINVIYTPEYTNSNNNNRDERAECNVQLRGKVAAYKVYKELIKQIREQMPDQLYLDKAIENLLNQDALADIEAEEINDKNELKVMEKEYDRRTKSLRRARKAKRANKKVLRKSKDRNRTRR